MMMIEDGNLCLLLAIEGLMAMIESPHFKTTFASLKHFDFCDYFVIILAGHMYLLTHFETKTSSKLLALIFTFQKCPQVPKDCENLMAKVDLL